MLFVWDAIQVSVQLLCYLIYFVYSNWSPGPSESYQSFHSSVVSNFPRDWLVIFFPTFSWRFFFFSKRKTNQNGNKMVKICSKSGFSRNLFIRFSWFFYVKSSNLLCWNFRSILDKKSGLTWLCPKNDYESLRFFLKESFCCGFNQN